MIRPTVAGKGKWLVLLATRTKESYLLLLVLLWLTKIRWGLRRSYFRLVQRQVLTSAQQSWVYSFNTPPSLSQITWAVNAGSWLMPGKVKCLAKALTLWAIAYQFGHRLDLRVGIAESKQAPPAIQAWVEHQNQIVFGKPPSNFKPLPSIPSNASL